MENSFGRGDIALSGAGVKGEARKVFFSEEKKQKTFIRLAQNVLMSARQRMKVFWFFFSKKNRLPVLSFHRVQKPLQHGGDLA
jgi:hypothetical protein